MESPTFPPGTRLDGPGHTPPSDVSPAKPEARPVTGGEETPVRPCVLVVDDDPPGAKALARGLGRLGYETLCAHGGLEALGVIADRRPDAVILDVVMPDLSGLEVLRRIRDDPATADLPVILASGLDQPEDIVDGLKIGANDYVTKPIDLAVLEAKLATRTALKRSRDELKYTVRAQAAVLDRTARELQMARRVQQSLLPRTPYRSELLATAWCYEPASEVGGDLFDVIALPGGRVLLFVADAMGHGVQAALVAATVKATLVAHLNEADDLPILLGLLDLTIGDLFDDLFVTAAVCVIDPAARTLRYAGAGHPPVLVSGRSGVTSLAPGSPPLGLGFALSFEGAGEIALDPGASILLYTDGLTEAEGRAKDQFGGEALCREFAARASSDPEDLVRGLRAALDGFRRPGPLADDLTILAARLL